MNIPLNWLSDYVDLPKDLDTLTSKLTSVGHMLDKIKKTNNETVIDLELRGNRSDMFGIIGTARDISAIFDKKLRLPEISPLPKKDLECPLISVDKSAAGLVKRYLALKLSVTIGPSPKWINERLLAYGITPINNVVDITNYVMIETSHPMHAFDFDRLNGGQLILRTAKKNESFATIQQGTALSLSPSDLVIADAKQVQGLTTVGGLNTKVTPSTTAIILETAVYDPTSSRRTARRHKTFTESGNRHEKHQDPHELTFTLSRALYLLKQYANAQTISEISDYYPHPIKPKTIDFKYSEITRLTGQEITPDECQAILERLEFKIDGTKITIPTFRTDIENSADIVEEITRLYGYDRIPEIPLSGPMPIPDTYPSYLLQEKIRDIMTSIGSSEYITYTLSANEASDSIRLVNPPDINQPYLRRNIYPQLTKYLDRSKLNFFEIGKIFSYNKNKYLEHLHLCITNSTSYTQLKGIVDTFTKLSGLNLNGKYGIENDVYWFEAKIDPAQNITPPTLYSVISRFPAIVEDVNIYYSGNYISLIKRIRTLSNLIKNIEFKDLYQNKLTLRITYHSDQRQLSSQDIAPIRSSLDSLQ